MLLIYSVYSKESGTDYLALNKVNLIADLVKKKPVPVKKPRAAVPQAATAVAQRSRDTAQGARDVDMYLLAHRYTYFYTDTSRAPFPALMHKLYAIKKGEKRKVRIAWLGDSMIEADLLTQTFRKRMQQQFGGCGAGFVPVKSVSAANRLTVKTATRGEWTDEHFKTESRRAPLHLSGHAFFAAGAGISMTDQTITDTTQQVQKSLLCGYAADGFNVVVNGVERHYNAPQPFNRIEMAAGNGKGVNVDFGTTSLPVYGVSFEGASGVVVDNFSFRGISGIELKTLETDFLKSVDSQRYYDLVVLEYGINVLYKKEDTEYAYYGKLMNKVLARLRAAMPNTAFLIIGTSDRAFMYDDGVWRSAIGMDSLVGLQARLAYANNMAFYNMYGNMGGEGTIVSWATATPPLANVDYVHPNWSGAAKLGNMLFDDFMQEYYRAAAYEAAHSANQ